MKTHLLYHYISEGEHIEQDFKHCINDSKKIAISLAAFANTIGGRLLIGVKDNGKIVGVNVDEEFHMIEAASAMFCKPKVTFTTEVHTIENRHVLEVKILKSAQKPHYAKDEQGKWIAYQRVEDNNKRINKLLLDIWKAEKRTDGSKLEFSTIDKQILRTIEGAEHCSFNWLHKRVPLNYFELQRKLVLFASFSLIEVSWIENRLLISICEDCD